jgi:hypothetical protein
MVFAFTSILATSTPRRERSGGGRFGVGVLDVPFTLPAASAKTSAGVSSLHVLYFRPSWP